MKIIPNARRVALRSFSMWANYLGVVVLILPEAIFYMTGYDANPRVWWGIGLALIVAGIIGRIIDQGGLDGDRSTFWARPIVAVLVALLFLPAMGELDQPPKPARAVQPLPAPPTEAETFKILLPFLETWEGVRLVAYQDIVGVWTICMGETRGVQPGDRLTIEDCRAHTREMAREYRTALHRHMTDETLARRLTPARDASMTSLTINIGQSAAGRSTAVKRLNAGDIEGACVAIGWWNKAGGRVVRGLVLRRQAEIDLCRAGLT